MKKSSIQRPLLSQQYNLTASEQLLLEYLNGFSKLEFNLTQKELATVTHTSESTVSRFIKKYKFSSYKEFIVSFNHKLHRLNTDYQLMKRQEEKGLIQNMLASHKYGIEHSLTPKILNQLETLVKELSKSKRVVFFGRGSSRVWAGQLYKNFSRIGINTIQPETFHNFLPVVGGAEEEDIFIIFSNRFDSKEILFAIRELYDKGCKVIVITSHQTQIYDNYLFLRIQYDKINNNNFFIPIGYKVSQMVISDVLFEMFLETDPKHKLRLRDAMSIFDKWNVPF